MKKSFHPLMIVMCMTLIIAQPVYSHPHNAMTRNGPSFGGAARFIHPFDTAHFSHQVTKRQASDDTDLEQYCRLYDQDLLCSSGTIQSGIDAYLNCGEMDTAHYYASSCGRNELGEYCLTVYYRLNTGHNTDPDLNYIDGNCSASLASGSCHANCRAQLQLLKDKLGCCSFYFIRSSDSYRIATNPSLWSLCGISTSASPCRIPNHLNLSTAVERNCTEAEWYQFYIEGLCQPGGVGQAHVNGVLDNEQCTQVEHYNSTALLIFTLCSVNAHEEYCYSSLLGNAPNWTINNLLNVERHCNSSNSNQCTQTCASSIMEAKSSLGCCINILNSSTSYTESDPFSYDLWISCGVELPGVCQNTLSLNVSRSTAGNYYTTTTESGYSSSESNINDSVPMSGLMETTDSYNSSKSIVDVTTESGYRSSERIVTVKTESSSKSIKGAITIIWIAALAVFINFLFCLDQM